jgi:hypothetical protein
VVPVGRERQPQAQVVDLGLDGVVCLYEVRLDSLSQLASFLSFHNLAYEKPALPKKRTLL